jgi:hypothetical protein
LVGDRILQALDERLVLMRDQNRAAIDDGMRRASSLLASSLQDSLERSRHQVAAETRAAMAKEVRCANASVCA